ncbi:MAG: peptidoglycan DD-metalloendopeptidase family protein, partial [Oscillospiraceae bacterium]
MITKNIKNNQDKITQLTNANKKLESSLKDIKSDINSAETQQAILSEQIVNIKSQIDLTEKQISLKEEEIAIKEVEINDKLVEIEENEELFAQRVRGMYMSSKTSLITLLLSAKNFSEFLTRAEFLKQISKSDQDLITDLTTEKESLIAAQTDLQAKKADFEQTKSDLSQKNSSLNSLKSKSEQLEAQLKANEEKYMKQKEANAAAIKKADAAIDKLLLERASIGKAPDGQYGWPVPSSTRITSPFGWRTLWGKKDFHTGIDIGAKNGQDIVAANAGTVISATFHPSYGNMIIVDHGGGHATLYAHASKLYVKVNDKVTRGQKIAAIGSTGASTGNHLHFEVRINSKRVDPMGYLK